MEVGFLFYSKVLCRACHITTSDKQYLFCFPTETLQEMLGHVEALSICGTKIQNIFLLLPIESV